MGRMADARKRARAEGTAAPGGAPPAPAPAQPAAPAQSRPDPTFADEPAAPERLTLPASGLAEDVLRQLSPQPAPATGGARITLPASGLAEDILARDDAAAVAAAVPPATPPGPPEPQASAVPGAHSLSFFAAPAQEQRAAAEATEHLATFFLDREEYGVEVRQVQEIRRVTEITSVPRAPEFVRGVINLRGRILPVLDLRRKLGLGEVVASPAARIVVVRVHERLLGLLVDGASQVLKVALSRIEPPPEEVVERVVYNNRGVAKLDDRLIILVDLERLLAHELRTAAAPSAGVRAGALPDDVSQE